MVETDTYRKFERRLALKSKSTEKNYRSGFKKFLKYCGLSPEEIISLAENDPEELEYQVLKVQKDMTEEGYKPTTASLIYKSLRFFLKANGFKGFSLDREDKPRMIYNGSAKVSKAQIREMYDKVGAQKRNRNRALLMLAKDSGLRISDLSKLNVQDYVEAETFWRDGRKFKKFKPKQTTKTGDYSHIIIGPEATDAIDTYLEVEGNDSGPLFISMKGGRLGPKAIAEVFRKFKTRPMQSGDFSDISAHSFRKFITNNSTIAAKWVRWLIGKSLDTYKDDPPEESIVEAYISKYDEELAVFDRKPQVDQSEFEALKKEQMDLKKTVKDQRLLLEKALEAMQSKDAKLGASRSLLDESIMITPTQEKGQTLIRGSNGKIVSPRPPPEEPPTRAELEAFRKRIQDLEEKIARDTKKT